MIAAVAIGFGVLSGTAGNTTAMRYGLLFGLIMILVAALGATMHTRNGDLSKDTGMVDGDGDHRYTEIRHSGLQFRLLVALMTCSAAFFMSAGIEVVVNREQSANAVIGTLFGAIGLYLVSFPLAAGFGLITRGGLLLSEHGVTQRGWSFENQLSWTDIAGIKPANNGHPIIMLIAYTNTPWQRRYTSRLWKIDRLPPVSMIEIDCRKFGVEPSALLSFLSAYVDTPDNRAELGTPATLDRARRSAS
ncbi:hypothetical protein O6072_21420 [Mycolicibacterium neoaurum]|uniref:hypothetical protein n=1 Tax=Mycolicibacterium neoaurum TaxID=1795 RepID=UPI00248D1C5A|nr:hypothetical protein [Mycolicibacterium neoaurum]WBP93583.1 hypothetical protein O7W24_20920 [Mycolicibacterium neoaurum]WBS07376.1 hypothetical protein O6072_21420 [Mycolicibacterium neoaurum]